MKNEVYPAEPRLFRHASGCVWSPAKMREVYNAVYEEWTAIGMTPNAISAYAPSVKGLGAGWGTLGRKQKKIEESGFVDIGSFGLARMGESCKPTRGGNTSMYSKDWLLFLNVGRTYDHFSLGWVPTLPDIDPQWFDRTFAKIADIVGPVRGHEEVIDYISEKPTISDDSESIEDFLDDQQYASSHLKGRGSGISLISQLRPVMFLGHAQLNAPMGINGDSLRIWLEQDPKARGVLRDFGSERLYEWRPPKSRMGQLREELFRGGRLYTRHFFLETKGPYARSNLTTPWEWTQETPGQFKPKFLEELRRTKEAALLNHVSSRERMEVRRLRLRTTQDEARKKHVEEALAKTAGKPPTTPKERRDYITRFHGMEYVAHRRHAREPGVLIDLREIERLTGRVLESTAFFVMGRCKPERFMYMSQQEIADELLRIDREGIPEDESIMKPEGRSLHCKVLGFDKRGITGFLWTTDRPLEPRTTVCLTLEEFFEDNADARSIRAKGRKNVTVPPFEECRRALFALRSTEAVDNVLITIGAFPDPDDSEDDLMWFHAEGALVYTRARVLKETKPQLKGLGMYKIGNWYRHTESFERVPELPVDCRIHRGRWWPSRDWRFPEAISEL